jgi:hypothetical protein
MEGRHLTLLRCVYDCLFVWVRVDLCGVVCMWLYVCVCVVRKERTKSKL